MKVIIAGSRSFNNYNKLKEVMAPMRSQIEEVVCGEARGADKLGRRWGEENGISIKSFPAQWDIYGKRAGFIRNELMGDYADYLIAFWDGKSRGTKYMIDYMKSLGKHGKVILF